MGVYRARTPRSSETWTHTGGVLDRRSASEPEVVASFLRGELDSSRFGAAVRSAVRRAGGLALLTDPDLLSPRENDARRAALAEARGWGSDHGLFAGFPTDVAWDHGLLEVGELARVRFIEDPYWTSLSGGSRRPADVRSTLEHPERLPAWLRQMDLEWPIELAEVIAKEGVPGELIVVGTSDLDELVVLEGHARLTALFFGALHDRMPVRAYVGTSSHIQRWQLF